MADDDTTETPPKGGGQQSLMDQARAQLKKASKDKVLGQLKAIAAEIEAAERTVRVKTAEAQKLVEDFEAGLL